MITTTDAPPWLRRSDQAVTWARTMLSPHRAVVIDCETTDLPGAICEVAVVDTTRRISAQHPCQSLPANLSGCHPRPQHHRQHGRRRTPISRSAE